MEGSYQAYPVDIENPHTSLETSMKRELKSLCGLSSSQCIYKVPKRLRCVNEKAYTPQIVSIGPLHHGKEALKDMEEEKRRYLQCFQHRTTVSLLEYIEKIRAKEEQLRSCYPETNKFNSDQFVRIILVDAAFIIELMLRSWEGRTKFRTLVDISPDMQLLENQLPFFILEDLFDPNKITVSSKREKLSMIDLSYKFLTNIIGLEETKESWRRISSSSRKVKHFLDFIRTLHLPDESDQSNEGSSTTPDQSNEGPSTTPNQSNEGPSTTPDQSNEGSNEGPSTTPDQSNEGPSTTPDQSNEGQSTPDQSNEGPSTTPDQSNEGPITTPCITKLHQAGVKFKLMRSSRNLFDIKFKDGILEIPKLKIDDHTELTLRNLIAFEQCHCVKHYITDYVSLIDNLVNTEKDVEFLKKDEIVEHILGDDNDVCTLINSLGRGVVLDDESFYFADLYKDLNSYCRKPWNEWKANLRQHYFNTPWSTISVIAAVFLLTLTCIQAVCSIISVMHSN
ncbi:unnamed protein product [Prunus brigantina]